MKQNRQEYFKKNAEWLEAKSKEDGVKALEKGVLYKVLQSGPESGRQAGDDERCHLSLPGQDYRRQVL